MKNKKMTKDRIEKIRKPFQEILNKKLEEIISEKNEKLRQLEKRKIMTKNKLEKIRIEGEKGRLDLHKHAIPFLDLISMIKKEDYFTKEILETYNQRYYKAIGYQFKNYSIMPKGATN